MNENEAQESKADGILANKCVDTQSNVFRLHTKSYTLVLHTGYNSDNDDHRSKGITFSPHLLSLEFQLKTKYINFTIQSSSVTQNTLSSSPGFPQQDDDL